MTSPLNPSPEEIRNARKTARLTQQRAADLMRVHMRTWQKWECGKARMPPGTFELFMMILESADPPQ